MIACGKCSKRSAFFYDGEWFERVYGTAKKDMTCDYCSVEIIKGDKCSAESMGVNGHGIPYYEWEHKYLII